VVIYELGVNSLNDLSEEEGQIQRKSESLKQDLDAVISTSSGENALVLGMVCLASHLGVIPYLNNMGPMLHAGQIS
jgi:hypothetical protein